jgi:DNA-binding transcriptional LysR family regulator
VPPELCHTELMEAPLDVALPADHPLASRDSIAVAELHDEDWISWRTSQICHDWLIRTLGANGPRPRVKHTASEHSTQLALLGAAVIPRPAANPHHPRSALIDTTTEHACWPG